MPRGIKNVINDPLLGNDLPEGGKQEGADEVVEGIVASKKGKISLADYEKDPVGFTKEKLAKSEHTNFIVPLGENEAVGSYETVQINGYRLSIQKGVMVNIPVAVANIIAEKYRIAMTVGRDKRADRSSDVSQKLD